MKHILLFAGLITFACACKKDQGQPAPNALANTYLSTLRASLADSLPPGLYRSLDFSCTITLQVDSLHTSYTRIALSGRPIAVDFLMAKTTLDGKLLAGRFVSIRRDSADLSSFSGTVRYTNMQGHERPWTRYSKARMMRAQPGSTNLKEQDPEMDGGELPPVIVSYSLTPQGISYADWYNLEDMASDDGSGNTGYYGPAVGGGGSPALVDFELPESKEGVDLQKYVNCFGSSQEAAATYTVTISVDLPVDNDPSRIFNWSDQSPGHTFIELYKNGSNGLVQQEIGFYPDHSWKTVGGGNIPSKIVDDGGHEYQAKYTISVTPAQFAAALAAAKTYSSNPYNVASFNCADFALDIFRAAGGVLTVAQFPVPGYSDASNTPQGVYDAIARLVLAGNKNALANGQKQWAGASHGACD